MGYRKDNWSEMTLSSTTILCFELSHFLLLSAVDTEAAKALHRAGLLLLTMQGIESDEYDSKEYLDADEIVRDLSRYFDYLHGHGMDHTSRNIILNAIQYICGISWEEVLDLEMVKKEIGWAREKQDE